MKIMFGSKNFRKKSENFFKTKKALKKIYKIILDQKGLEKNLEYFFFIKNSLKKILKIFQDYETFKKNLQTIKNKFKFLFESKGFGKKSG